MREADIWKVLSRPKRSQIPKQARGLPPTEEFLDSEITQRLKKEQLEQERGEQEKKKILGRRLRLLRYSGHWTQAEIGDISDIENLPLVNMSAARRDSTGRCWSRRHPRM